jgi:hypothetical protein
MRTYMLLISMGALAACNATALVVGEPALLSDDADVDADTDTDADADADADTDADTDSGDTGEDGPLVEPPDILVDCEGEGDFVSIQAALDASVSGDRIGLAPCVYHERFDYSGKAVEIYGIEGSSETTIDGDDGGTIVDFEAGEGGWARLAGVTLTGGYDLYDGAAIEVFYSGAELEDVVITGNTGLSMIRAMVGWLDMTDVVIEDNMVDPGGQAVFSDGGTFTVKRSYIDCSGSAQAVYHHNPLVASDSTFVCDTGYGIHNYHGEGSLYRVRVDGGISGIFAYDNANLPEEPDSPTEVLTLHNTIASGGYRGVDALYMHVEVFNSVLWGGDAGLSLFECDGSSRVANSAFVDSACGIRGDQTYGGVRFSAFWNNADNGCGWTFAPTVTDDPMFVDFPDDLSLDARSPLINAGAPDAEWTDLDGTRNDIGAYGGPYAWW